MKRISMLAMALLLLAAMPLSAQTSINGAGATFPYPIYSKWFDQYHKLHPDVQINYQSMGSGAGIRQVIAGTVDFGASDQPMTEEQLKQAKLTILHLPTVLGAVVPAYNLRGLNQPIKFTAEALAGIFLGTITTWNDPRIAKANPGLKLPADDIVVIHRSDGSGTTFVWTDFLSKVSAEWKSKVGANTSVRWPVGLGGKGNEGVAGLVKQTPGSIGYMEPVYAQQNQLPYGSVQNAAGEFVRADPASVTQAAAAAAKNMPADFRVSITNPDGKGAYPVASFTWLLVPVRWNDAQKGRAMVEFLKWMLADGQQIAPSLGYAPLPKEVIARELEAITRIQVGS